MPLPSSIWVKFTNEDAVLVTYLGVEYRLTPQTVDGNPYYYAVISGTLTDGYVLSYAGANDDQDLSGSETTNIRLAQYISGVETDPTAVGTITYSAWSVTSFTGSAISAATIVHRDSRLPLFVELPNIFEMEGVYGVLGVSLGGEDLWGVEVDVLGNDVGVLLAVNLPTPPGENSYSLTWNSTTNTGTTSCPFVTFIGELPITEVFTESGTWTPSANIDTTKPVIVEAWGGGADGGIGGGGGGSYSAMDVSGLVSATAVAVVADTPLINNGTSWVTDDADLTVVAYSAADDIGGDSGMNTGDVKFSGANAVTTTGGGSAFPYQNASGATGYGAGGLDTVAGSIPGGGGGASALGARGEVRIHYRLQAESAPVADQPASIINHIGIGFNSVIRNQTGIGSSFKTITAPASTEIDNSIRFGTKNLSLRQITSDWRHCLAVFDITGLSPVSTTQVVNYKGKTFLLKKVTISNVDYHVLAITSSVYSISDEIFSMTNALIASQGEKVIVYKETLTPTEYGTVKFGDRNLLVAKSNNKWYLCVNEV